jgi:hypothetical protein
VADLAIRRANLLAAQSGWCRYAQILEVGTRAWSSAAAPNLAQQLRPAALARSTNNTVTPVERGTRCRCAAPEFT